MRLAEGKEEQEPLPAFSWSHFAGALCPCFVLILVVRESEDTGSPVELQLWASWVYGLEAS